MGRWYFGTKTEADDLKKIETSFLKKHGYFCGWKSGTITWTNGWSENKSSVGIEVSVMDNENYFRIHYTQTDRDSGEKKDFDYRIPLTTTPCHFGGKRYWFICPWYKNGEYCGRRVGYSTKTETISPADTAIISPIAPEIPTDVIDSSLSSLSLI